MSWVSVLNSIGAGSDILILIRVVIQVPSNSVVMESHDSIYWHSNKIYSELSST
jgi:hypothetical protein